MHPAACLDPTVQPCAENTQDDAEQRRFQTIRDDIALPKLISFNTNLPDPKLGDAVERVCLDPWIAGEEIIPAQPHIVGTTRPSHSDPTFLEMLWKEIQGKRKDFTDGLKKSPTLLIQWEKNEETMNKQPLLQSG